MKKYKLECDGMYGLVKLSKEDFDSIPTNLFHQLNEDTAKYMNANPKEEDYLKGIGCYDDISDEVYGCVDWFKVDLNNA